jgi:negative regulator of sigma E activity
MKRLLLSTIALSVAVGAVAQSDSRALEYLRRTMERDLRTTYTAIRLLTAWGCSEATRVKRDQSETGQSAVLVLAPLSKQGETTVDDGKNWVQYFPDKGVLIVQDSPLKREGALDYSVRFELLKRNYAVAQEGVDVVAGRKANKVLIRPAADDELYARRFWIDKDTSVLLRVEWQDPSGKSQIVSETLFIEYPTSLPEDTFRYRIAGKPQRIEVQAPARQTSITALSGKVGFAVLQPPQMPFGFAFTGADAVFANNRALAALRYSDGATNVTVYQAKWNSTNPPWHLSRTRGDFVQDGLLIAVEGDLPAAGRNEIIDALKATSAANEAKLVARAAALLSADADTVAGLRGLGFGYEEAIATLFLSKGDAKLREKCVNQFRAGKSIASVARLFDAREGDVRRIIQQFWGG